MTEITPARREEVERLKKLALTVKDESLKMSTRVAALFNLCEANKDTAGFILSLIAWGEAAERERDEAEALRAEYPPRIADMMERLAAAESRAAQAEQERDEARSDLTALQHALGGNSGVSAMIAATEIKQRLDAERAMSLEAEKECAFWRLRSADMTTRAAQFEAQVRMMAGALRHHHKWHCDLGVIGLHKNEDGSWTEVDMSGEYGDSTLCSITEAALSTPPAAVALAEREVIERLLQNKWAWRAYLSDINNVELKDKHCGTKEALDEAIDRLLAARAAKDEPARDFTPCDNPDHPRGCVHDAPAPASEGERHEFVLGLGHGQPCWHKKANGLYCGFGRNHPVHTGGE